jgi:hypothetical protein
LGEKEEVFLFKEREGKRAVKTERTERRKGYVQVGGLWAMSGLLGRRVAILLPVIEAGLRVQIGYFFTRYQISIGWIVVPALVPTVFCPYPHPSGLLPVGLRIFFTRCHL